MEMVMNKSIVKVLVIGHTVITLDLIAVVIAAQTILQIIQRTRHLNFNIYFVK